MGRCSSCRRKTLFFCFTNREFVCLNCVFQPRYELSVVRSYKDWIQDPTYPETVRCPFSGRELRHGDDILRLPPPDLRVVSAAALLEYLRANFGANTAPAGFLNQHLPYGVVPDPADDSAVAMRLRKFLMAAGYGAAVAVAAANVDGVEGARGRASSSGGGGSAVQRGEVEDIESQTKAAARKTLLPGAHPSSQTLRRDDGDDKERKIRQQKIRKFLNLLGRSTEVLPLNHAHGRPNRRSRRLCGLLLLLTVILLLSSGGYWMLRGGGGEVGRRTLEQLRNAGQSASWSTLSAADADIPAAA
eukprot:ctg_77.g36